MAKNSQELVTVLLEWIENRLGESLSVEDITKKSGYTKWHMQRIFKDVTGISLGVYTRRRRLSKAAVALRMTSRSIIDIGMQYHFDSQPAFTRAFKNQFNETPARYRHMDNWHTAGIQPPYRISGSEIPRHEIVRLDNLKLVGHIASYHCHLENVSEYREKIRSDFWYLLLEGAKKVPPVIYGLHEVKASTTRDDEQQVFYSAAVSEEYLSLDLNRHGDIVREEGDYARFTYQGDLKGLQNFILLLYSTCMPLAGLVRRQGQDIECYYTHQGNWHDMLPYEIHCDYFIPVSLAQSSMENADLAV